MMGSIPKTGVAPPSEGDPGTPPLMAGHAITGPDGVLGLRGRRAAGLALRLASPEGEDDELFEIAVTDEHGAVALALGPYPADDVVAVWRSLGGASGLPLLVQAPDGSLSAPYPQIGPLKLGASRMRRRIGLLTGRRPRFLTRRKPGRLPARPLVFREGALSEGHGA